MLWCVTLLSVVVVGALYSTRLHLNAAKNFEDKIQAHYLALAGIENAKALLFHESGARKKAGRHFSGELYNAPDSFKEIELGRGRYSVIRPGTTDEGGGVLYGVSDEESRLNINTVSREELARIREMPQEIAAAIMDWRDRDHSAMPGGAERDYYGTLKPPYLPRNGEIQTLREMLLIRGVTSKLLFGEDANGNHFLDPEENDGDENAPADNRDNELDGGWADYFCIHSSTGNKNAGGEDRINIQSASESELGKVRGLTPELAKAIVEWRGQTQLENMADLLDVTALAPARPGRPAQNQPGQSPRVPNPGQPQQQQQGQQQRQPTGPKLINQDTLIDMADDITIPDVSPKGLVNINTASPQVLFLLNGMTEELAQAVVNHRSSSGYFANVAAILNVPGMTPQIFKQISKRITARSETFRIVSEGRVTATGARERLEAVVRLSGNLVETVYYRENL